MNVVVHAATDIGLKRAQNEDQHAHWVPNSPADASLGTLLVIADGMGGARAGEVASQLAVETVMLRYRESSAASPLERLSEAFVAANAAVHEQSVARPELRGMGTTCTAMVIRDREAFVSHVGDSRAYLVRGGAIHQLTRDHSLVAQLVLSNQITAEEARFDPRRNVVTRSVGVSPSVEIDSEKIESSLEPGDTLLLCTDGLHGLVSDVELAVLASASDLEGACDQMIELAKDRGGHDNITVMMARVTADGAA